MGKLRCPHCGSKDCKECLITFDRIAIVVENFGTQVIKRILNGKMDYNTAIQDTSRDLTFDNMDKKTYRCKNCGHTWEI